MSIRARLALWYGGLVAVTILIVAAAVWQQFDSRLRGSLDEALQVRNADVRASLETPGAAAVERVDPTRPGIFTAVFDARGRIRRLDPQVPEGLGLPEPGASIRQLVPGGPSYALLTTTVTDGQTIVSGSSLAAVDEAAARLAELLIAIGGAAALLSLLGGWWLAGRALAPVGRITEEVRGIGPNELDRRVREPRRQDELGRLAQTLNGLLSRVEGAIVRERAFITGAAHDLRTPIASLRTALELANASESDADALRAEVHDALADAVRLSELADGLLRLAEVQADGAPEPPEAVTIRDALAAAARDVAWEAGARNIRVEIECPPITAFLGRVHLSQAVGNLLLNAVRHGADGEPVEVVASLALTAGPAPGVEQVLRVEVRDRGRGIDPSRKGDLFMPFASRHGGAATPGGLGLATAAAAVKIEGGQIGHEGRTGGGSIFWFTLPLRDPDVESVAARRARDQGRPAVAF